MQDRQLNLALIIDDDTTSLYLTTTLLEDMGTFKEILTASNGREGLAIIMQRCLNDPASNGHCPDLILLDINMPIMDGFEVVKELEKIGHHRLIEESIVVLTSSNNPRDRQKMLDYGVKQYIEKPFTDSKLLPLLEGL